MDLYQGSYWEDEDGDRIWIRNMSPRHALNCCQWLERHAATIAEADSWNMLRAGFWIGGEQAALDFEAGLEQDDAEKAADPVEWIRETPVWQALDRQSRAEVTIENFFR